MDKKGPAVRKRAQIASANKTMFMWVAGVSVIFGAAVVAAIFLVQMLIFNEKVLSEKQHTVSNLEKDAKNIVELKDNVRGLSTNDNLGSIKANSDDQNLQVILDALPSDANSLAFGASLQNKLLSGINGLTIDTLQVNPVAGVESTNSSSNVVNNDSGNSVAQGEVTFSFSVHGDVNAIKKVLQNLEKSIRAIYVTSAKIETQTASNSLTLTVQGKTFYEPSKKLSLVKKVIKQ